jgi:TolB protein
VIAVQTWPSSGSKSRASASRSCRSPSRPSAARPRAAEDLGHRAGRPRTQRPVPRRRRLGQALDETTRPDLGPWRSARGRLARGRQRHAPGRRPLRRALPPVGRGARPGPGRPRATPCGRATCGWRRTASPTSSTRSSPARRASSPPASPTSPRPAAATTCGWPMPMARTRSRRWPAPSPSSRRRGRPTAAQLAYVSFESRKPVVYVHEVASGQRRLLANFKGSNSAPAWAPDGRTLAVTLSRDGGSQLYTIDRRRRRAAPADAVEQHRHRAGVLGRRPQHLLRQRPRRRAADLPHGRHRRLAQRVTFTGTYNISPPLSPTGGGWPTFPASGGAFKLHVMELAVRQCHRDHRHHRRREPELRAQRPADRLCHAPEWPRGADDDHARRQDQGTAGGQGGDIREPDWGPFQQ